MSERVIELRTPPQAGPPEFERTPPQDVAAEQSVLGGMLLSKDAIADVIEVLKTGDFYRPAHQLIFDIVIELYGKGEPADAITVGNELTRTGDLSRIGGLPYLHTLMSSVPTAANAGYYAKIVAELAILRRLVEAGTRIVQLGYSADGGEVDQIVDRAQQTIYEVTERRTSDDYTVLEDLMQPTMDELEAIGGRSGGLSGVPTGFIDLDNLTNGLHPGQLIVIAGRPGLGKALALDTPLTTPTGWTTMGAVSVGDELLGADGRPTRIVAVTDVLLGRPCYEVTFSDGTTIVADAEHQWVTSDGVVRTTELLALTVDRGHEVSTCAALATAEPAVAAPYALGVAVAGSTEVSAEVRMRLDVDVPAGTPTRPSRTVGLRSVLRAAAVVRSSALAGVADASGRVEADGAIVLPWRVGLSELVVGLGHVVTPRGGELRVEAVGRVFLDTDKHLLHKELSQAAGTRTITAVTAVPSVPVRCVEVDNAQHLYLASRSMIPTHNSTLGLDIARSASIRTGQASVIFSLEMSKTEITMRLLSAEARVPLHHMRSGSMTDDDWARLARKMGEVAEAPLYIDDSPNLTMMEIRAKARRLKQRNDLRLIVIDYMQLMSGNKKAESRQQEVSELSRSLKLLAKELEVPVIAMSQLNRGAEQRTDKKPMLSDLRESGCLPASTRVLRADTGAQVTLGELHASGATDVPIWSLDPSLRYVRRHLTHVFATGTREVFRLRLASGKTVRATANHPFLTYDGWRPLGELAPGARLAVPRHVPAPEQEVAWPEDEVVMLAHLLGDGSFVRRQPIRYASKDEQNLAAVTAAARSFGITAVRDDFAAARCISLRLPAPFRLARGRRNPIAVWLDDLGLFGLRSVETFVPAPVFCLPKRQIRLFLRHLWATDGSVTVSKNGRSGRVYYASTSRRLIDDVVQLLLRFGISCRVRRNVPASGHRDQWTLDIVGVEDQRRFLGEIGVHGDRAVQVERLLLALSDVKANTNVDTIPREVWHRVKDVLIEQGVTHRQFAAAMGTAFGGSALWKPAPSRPRLARVAKLLEDRELELLATNDVLWDEVVAIEPDGVEEVFDATVVGTHNFVADGIAVHNSIEQDADMVILLHREDAYEKESPRAGEADFIVAKHRNGPTATITVAFQGHYSRFVDMSPS